MKSSIRKQKELSVDLTFQEKAKIIKQKLSDTVGIFAIVKDGFVVISKCENAFSIEGPLPFSSYFKVLGITNSVNAGREVEYIVQGIRSEVSQVFSPRDINAILLAEGLSEAIEEDFYDSDNEKPRPVELLFLTINPGNLGVVSVCYNGERVIPNLNQDKFVIFGCTEESKKKKLHDFLKSKKLSDIVMSDFVKLLSRQLKQFSGTLLYETAELIGSDKKQKKKQEAT